MSEGSIMGTNDPKEDCDWALESSGNFCDVTGVVATTHVLRFLSRAPEDKSIDMFARLRNLFRRARVDGRETRGEEKETALSSESNEGRRRWSWGMRRAGRQTSSPENALSKKQAKKEEEKLTTELQLITQERNGVNDRLISMTEGAMNKSGFQKLNPMYEQWKLKEKEVMTFLHNLEMEKIEAQENIQELKKEINFYSRLLMEKMLVKKRRVMLRQESKEVRVDWSLIEKYLVGLNMNGVDEQEKTSNLLTQHQGPRNWSKS
ncbi:Spermatogenesis-associated glutamate (E)-rich protein 4C [Apodemus speciosus]|uniref:Spermatogenesis-associated glutamate (E)-rich protein 4C n=1 Tax=Apodemus speciosus TaxID=105296 RepID=A0ABQ0ERE4_APOSI